MKYTRDFLINGKKPSLFNDGVFGTTKDLIFTDCETKKEFKSFMDMTKEFGIDEYYQSDSYCTKRYHRYSMFSTYVYTDGVYSFCDKYSCWWLQDVITSIYPKISEWLIKFDSTGHWEQVENKKGCNDFLIIRLQKVSENKAVFTVESDCWKEGNEENKTVYVQYIPFTDIEIDTLELYSEQGVILFPSEH